MIVKLTSLAKTESEFLHSPFTPEPIREGDAVSGVLEYFGSEHSVRVWRYSPFGLEFVAPKGLTIAVGATCGFRLKFGAETIQYQAVTVSHIEDSGTQNLIGLRLFRPNRSGQTEVDRRSKTRWSCPDDFLPTGTAANPIRFNDFILFRIDNISAGGLRLITSMRNKLIAIGQQLDLVVSLPLVGSVGVVVNVKHIDTEIVNGKEYLAIGTQLVHPDNILLQSLSEYLLNFGEGVSVSTLKEDGFPLGKASKWLDFTYVKSESEYREVLELRLRAYKAAQKIPVSAVASDMSDEFDSRARILCVKHKGRIVGSVRVMFHAEGEKTHLEADGCELPKTMPKLSDCVEASRMCTDPDIRGADILHQLQAHMVLLAVKNGKRFIFGGAADSLVDMYVKCGFTQTGHFYSNESLSNIEHEVIYIDTHKAVLGVGVGPRNWRKIYADLYEYMVEREHIAPTTMDELRIWFYRLGAGA